jgi:hypothetical protein
VQPNQGEFRYASLLAHSIEKHERYAAFISIPHPSSYMVIDSNYIYIEEGNMYIQSNGQGPSHQETRGRRNDEDPHSYRRNERILRTLFKSYLDGVPLMNA